MPRWSKEITISSLLQFCLGLFLFLLPWPTIYIIQEKFVNGYKWEYGTIGFYATEIILWLTILVFMIWYWQEKKTRARDLKFTFSKMALSSGRICPERKSAMPSTPKFVGLP